ncbi:hypothetical protein JCM5296_004907 [Sporobolomyces johnsonii]
MSARPSLLSQNSASRRREPSFPSYQTRGSSSVSSPRQNGSSDFSTPSRKKGGPSLSLALNSPPLNADGTQAIHPLKYTWDVWFSHRSGSNKGKKDEQGKAGQNGPVKEKESKEEWEEGVVKLGGFSSIESLHPFLAHLVPPSALPASVHSTAALFSSTSSESTLPANNVISDYNIFRSSIAPAWEDTANVGGGRWVLRLRKGVADRVWEEVVYALVGERIGGDDERVGEKINGVVLSVRKDEDILSLWVAPSNRTERDIIRDSLRAALQPILTPAAAANLQLDYKPHPVIGGTPNGTSSRLVDLSGNNDTPSRPHHHHRTSHRHDPTAEGGETPRRPHAHADRPDGTPNGSSSERRERTPRGVGFSSYVARLGGESAEHSRERTPTFPRSREASPGGVGVGVIGAGFGRPRRQESEEGGARAAAPATSWGRL